MSKLRGQRKAKNLSIEQLSAIARHLGYELVVIWPPHYSASLYDCRTGNIEKRGDAAFEHLRFLYKERALGVLEDIPGLDAAEIAAGGA
jgi:hypothetical protein